MPMRLGLALLLTLALAAPAGAASPGPTILDFEDRSPGGTSNPSERGASFGRRMRLVRRRPGGSRRRAQLRFGCSPGSITFSAGQRVVSVFHLRVRRHRCLVDAPLDGSGEVVAADSMTVSPGEWAATRDHGGSAVDPVHRLLFRGDPRGRFPELHLDDVGFSPEAQPDADITGGPSGTVPTGDATFTFAANQPGASVFCKLDGAASAPCTSPVSYTGLADGAAHVLGDHRRQVGDDGRDARHAGVDRGAAGRSRRGRRGRRRRQLPGQRQRGPGGRGQGRRRRRVRAAAARHRADRGGQGDPRAAAVRRGVREAPGRSVGERVHGGPARPVPGRRLHPAQGRRHGPDRLHARHPQGRGGPDRGAERAAAAEQPPAAPRGALPRGHLPDPPGAQEPQARAEGEDPRERAAGQPGRSRGRVRPQRTGRRPAQGRTRAVARP